MRGVTFSIKGVRGFGGEGSLSRRIKRAFAKGFHSLPLPPRTQFRQELSKALTLPPQKRKISLSRSRACFRSGSKPFHTFFSFPYGADRRFDCSLAQIDVCPRRGELFRSALSATLCPNHSRLVYCLVGNPLGFVSEVGLKSRCSTAGGFTSPAGI